MVCVLTESYKCSSRVQIWSSKSCTKISIVTRDRREHYLCMQVYQTLLRVRGSGLGMDGTIPGILRFPLLQICVPINPSVLFSPVQQSHGINKTVPGVLHLLTLRGGMGEGNGRINVSINGHYYKMSIL